MNDALGTYLQDHLAGAEFALALLRDLSSQSDDPDTGSVCNDLIGEIEQDRDELKKLVTHLGQQTSPLKEALAGLVQKLSRGKLDITQDVGLFESVELLSLGVLGKIALWKTLETLSKTQRTPFQLNLPRLIRRAESQHSTLEAQRRKLCVKTFANLGEVIAN